MQSSLPRHRRTGDGPPMSARLYDRICTQMGFTMPFAKALQAIAAHSVVIEATNVRVWLDDALGTTPVEERLSLFERCVPPFDRTLVEYAIPERDTDGRPMYAGCFVAITDRAPDDTRTIEAVTWMADAEVCAPLPMMVRIPVSANGTPDWDRVQIGDAAKQDSAWQEQFSTDDMGYLMKDVYRGLAVALMTFRFMHARGVEVRENSPTRAERRRAEREGKPAPVTYKTLEIGAPVKRLREEGDLEHVGLRRAMHLCRGHFADYTQGAGLFGKYKVEVFVPEHVRGNASRGVVVKDYRIGGEATP